MRPDEALSELLGQLFTTAGLRRWLEAGPAQLRAVAKEVPSGDASHAALLHATVRLIAAPNLNAEVFLALVSARPWQEARIREVALANGIALDDEAVGAARRTAVAALGEDRPRADRVVELEQLLLERERHLKDGNPPPDLGQRIDRLVLEILDGGGVRAGAALAGARLLKVIGTGNFGTIWLAEDLRTHEAVAVKVFRTEHLANGVMLWRFRRSIRAMRQLTDDRRAPPTIAKLRAVEADGLAFSMPYLSGGNLEEVGRRGWSLQV